MKDSQTFTSIADSPVARLITFWIPERFVTDTGVDARSFLAYLDKTLEERGFVLNDGQLVGSPLRLVAAEGVLTAERVEMPDLGVSTRRPIQLGAGFEIQFDSDSKGPFPKPELKGWTDLQKDHFGFDNPYQMYEEVGEFSWSNLSGYFPFSLLENGEFISGIVHSERNDRPFYCDCNYAQVVYTTHGRVVCMACGGLHLVLRQPLALCDSTRMSVADFHAAFGNDGAMTEIDVALPIIDFQILDRADHLWDTELWRAAEDEALFFLNSSAEEIDEFLSRTQVHPSMLLEMGWERDESQLPPAVRIAVGEVSLDLIANARTSLLRGLNAFSISSEHNVELLTAIQELFHAIELLMKELLQSLDGTALEDHPNNPTVMRRLLDKKISLRAEDIAVVNSIRKLRNDIQHGAPSFPYRVGRKTARGAVIFLNQFAYGHFEGWILEDCSHEVRCKLLKVSELSDTADEILRIKKHVMREGNVEFQLCPRCHRESIVRAAPHLGAKCLVCAFIPVSEPKD